MLHFRQDIHADPQWLAKLLERDAGPQAGKAAPATLAQAADLAEAWGRLGAAARLPTQEEGFVNALAGSLLAKAHFRLFVAQGAQAVTALVVLCRDGGPFARWRLPGVREVSEPCDALYASPQAAADLARQLARQPRALAFERVPTSSALIEALRDAMAGRGLVSVRSAVACPTIALDAAWREPESQFNAGRRSDFRRAARRAAEMGRVEYEIIAPEPGEFDALFDEASAVEVNSWKREAGSALAVCRDKQAFFRSFFLSACARGAMRIAFMRIDGKAVAMQLALQRNGGWWLFKIGYDEAYAKCSPGTLLMLHTLRHAATQGLTAYEMMGNIEPWIADFWTREAHGCVRLRSYPYNMQGAVALLADGVGWCWERARAQPWGLRPLARRGWAGLRALRYAGPGWLGARLPSPRPQAAGRMARALAAQGLAASFGWFHKGGDTPDSLVAAYRATAQALDGADAYLSVKAPPLGFDADALRAIAQAGLPVMLDAHAPKDAAPTLALLQGLLANATPAGMAANAAPAGMAANAAPVGMVLPARWQRSAADALTLRDTPARLRIVKGEWADPQADMPDGAYMQLVLALAGRAAPVAIATHDAGLAHAALSALQAAGTPCELELLRGLPRRACMAVAQDLGVRARLYVPLGPGWWPYAIDKALARPYLLRWWLADRLGR